MTKGKITDVQELKNVAKKIRVNILHMLTQAGSGHTGGSLSAADVAVAIYFSKMNFNPDNPKWEGRDRFILSKGHAAPLLYAIMAEAGYFPMETINNLRKIESPLQGHPCCKHIPGIEVSTGSLGQGLSVANGMALGLRLDNNPARVYCIMGDGEIQEGQIWEAAMTAAHYKIDNLCAVVDNNELQIDGPVEEVMGIQPVHDKWEAFGWHVISIDGHDMEEILRALGEAEGVKGKPTIIIANTTKGKGVSFFEDKVEYHGIAPSQEEFDKAVKEIHNG
ncbi:MAG TPA: transketolase [Nitrospirae bacterium]|nr:transketolase [Nitrospirota bacterium]HDZ00065.1 transketolase [Nitrospirota bacterium]